MFGTTQNDKDVYVRERFGHLTIRIDDIDVFYKYVGHDFDGLMDLIEATKEEFEWPYALLCWQAVELSNSLYDKD